MNKLLTKIVGAIACLTMVIGVGFAVANHKETNRVEAAIDPNTEAVAFTLNAKYNNSNSDSSDEISATPNNLFTNGSTYLSTATSSKVYLGASSAAALKFGSSSAKGTMSLTLKSGAQDTTYTPTKVIFSIAAANDTAKKINLSLNNASSGTGFSQITYGNTAKEFADYEVAWDGATTLTSIGVQAVNASKNRFYLKSITVVVASTTHYNISFNSLGGGSFDTIQVDEGKAIGTLPAPSKPKDEVNQKRYAFLGWYALSNTDDPNNPTFEGATEYTASTIVNSDVTLYAKYQAINYYKVVFDSRGGSAVATQEVDAGEKASVPEEPTKESDNNYSYAFAGWYREEGCANSYDFNTAVNSNITLYAKWNPSLLPAKSVAATKETTSSLAYSDYHKTSAVDALTAALTEVSGTSYTAWQKDGPTSDAIYSGKSANNNGALQLNNPNDKKPGIVSTTSGGVVASVSVAWNDGTSSGRTLEIYGKNTAYSSPADLYGDAKGTLIGTIVKGTNTSLTIETQYKYIGIKATGALYLDTLDIEWQEYSFDNLAIRFTGSIEEELWDRLHSESTITGYGMLLSTESFLNGDDLKDYYELADGSAVKNFDNTDTVHDPALKPTPTLKDGYYVWNLFKRVSLAKATTPYVAVAYIKLNNDEIVFLQQETASVKSLAQDLIAGPDRDENSLGGSLNYLANL